MCGEIEGDMGKGDGMYGGSCGKMGENVAAVWRQAEDTVEERVERRLTEVESETRRAVTVTLEEKYVLMQTGVNGERRCRLKGLTRHHDSED